MLPFLFDAMLSPCFKKQFTWTGKTKEKGIRKIPMKNHQPTLKILLDVCQERDKPFNDVRFSKTIKYKCLKYAYLDNNNETVATVDLAVSCDEN